MGLDPAVVDAASWALASTLHRRHPHLNLIRMHPAGGYYDVLCLSSGGGPKIMLNRVLGVGTIQVHQRADGTEPTTIRPIQWMDYLSTDPLEFIERIEHEAGLHEPPVLPLAPSAAVYATIAALAALGPTGGPFTISEGFIDTAGLNRGPQTWWATARALASSLADRQVSDPYGQPGYRFWRVERDDFDAIFETSTATMWTQIDEFEAAYDDIDHDDLMSEIAIESLRSEHTFGLIEAPLVRSFSDADPSDTGFNTVRNDCWPKQVGTVTPTLSLLQTALDYGRQ